MSAKMKPDHHVTLERQAVYVDTTYYQPKQPAPAKFTRNGYWDTCHDTTHTTVTTRKPAPKGREPFRKFFKKAKP